VVFQGLAGDAPHDVFDYGLPISLQNPLNLLQGSQRVWDVLKGGGADGRIKAFILGGHVSNISTRCMEKGTVKAGSPEPLSSLKEERYG
jgi:hypothetical protein